MVDTEYTDDKTKLGAEVIRQQHTIRCSGLQGAHLRYHFDEISVKEHTPQVVAWLVPLEVTNIPVTMKIPNRVDPAKLRLESSVVRDSMNAMKRGAAAAPQLSRQRAARQPILIEGAYNGSC